MDKKILSDCNATNYLECPDKRKKKKTSQILLGFQSSWLILILLLFLYCIPEVYKSLYCDNRIEGLLKNNNNINDISFKTLPLLNQNKKIIYEYYISWLI